MKVESINFLGPIEDIDNTFYSNINVFINLENDLNYAVVVGTLENLSRLMGNEKSEFLSS